MTEYEKGRFCPHTHEWCPDCTHTCRIKGLLEWVNGLSLGSDSFGVMNTTIPDALSGLSEKQVKSFYKELNAPSPDPETDEDLEPFKKNFSDFL